MQTLEKINQMISWIFVFCYFYQVLFIPVAFVKKKPQRIRNEKKNYYAVLVCARNEEKVIGNLLTSLKNQTYQNFTCFVLADNCSDQTAMIARSFGAKVYERFNTVSVGKGYALEELLKKIKKDYPEGFDGYLVFDADNALKEDYIEQMNISMNRGNDIITGYRNSLNYGTNWISAGSALWFIRESQYLNRARYKFGSSCTVGGTGFLFSRKVADYLDGWHYHLLTEDIEFSVDMILKGYRIAYCQEAELYDEQPETMKVSIAQRERWSKGFLQVFRNYGLRLLHGTLLGSFSCYDMINNIAPAFFLSVVMLILNGILIVYDGIKINDIYVVAKMLGMGYVTFYLLGLLTTITEWKHLRTTNIKKILYTFTFPFFMATYFPIALMALFKKPEWKPIVHHCTIENSL